MTFTFSQFEAYIISHADPTDPSIWIVMEHGDPLGVVYGNTFDAIIAYSITNPDCIRSLYDGYIEHIAEFPDSDDVLNYILCDIDGDIGFWFRETEVLSEK